MSATKPTTPTPKPEWREPSIQELGNLRDFVRAGAAFGKSAISPDSSTMSASESML
jgi:hypothetical protein